MRAGCKGTSPTLQSLHRGEEIYSSCQVWLIRQSPFISYCLSLHPFILFFFFWLHPGALLPWVPCVTLTSGRQPGPRSWGFFHNLPALGTLINQDPQIRALQIDCQQSPGSPHWFFHTAALAEWNGQTRWERRLGKGSYRAGGAPGVCSNGPGEPRSYGRCPCPWQWWEMR